MASRGRNLRTRVITGVVLAPVVLAASFWGGLIFFAVVVATALFAMREWVRMVGATEYEQAVDLSSGFVMASLTLAATVGVEAGCALLIVLAAALTAVLRRRGAADHRLIVFGLPYIGFGCMSLLWLRGQPEIGLALLVFLVLTVWATDIAGYATGRIVGGPKLAPRISPNKTWSGFGGAVVGAALVGFGVAIAFGAALPALALLVAAVLAVVSQGGDLFESAIKRRFGVKDSGRLIPGHGGILDRIDGLIAAAPALAVFHAAIGVSVPWW